MDWRRILFIIAIGLLAGRPTAASERPVIGAIIAMQGTVIAWDSNGQERFLATEARLYQGDRIETRADGFAELLFVDEAALKLGPNSFLNLQQVEYLPEHQDGKFLISLNRGIMRFYSGSQPSENYQVKTPTLTITPNGTIFDVIVQRDKAATVVLRSGSVVLSNASREPRSIKIIGRASTARRNNDAPSKPQRASAALFKQTKFLDKVPGQTAANLLNASPALPKISPAVKSPPPPVQPEKSTPKPTRKTIEKTKDQARKKGPDAVKSQPGTTVESILPPRKSITAPRKTKRDGKRKAKNTSKKKSKKTTKAKITRKSPRKNMKRPPRPRIKPEKLN